MSSTYSYDRDGFLSEFLPDAEDRAEVEPGAQALADVNRAHPMAEMSERLGLAPAEVAEGVNVRKER